jgi:DnaJ-class molecular chaperone
MTVPFLTAVKGGETTIEVVRSGGGRETLTVKIPPGTDSGARLRLRGRGEPGDSGAPAGDLIIQVEVAPHPYFTRDGRDLQVEVPISLDEAVLGARIDVPTLDGAKTLPIPAGTSGGQRLRLRGQGVPARGDKPAGDLFVLIKVVVPKSADAESQDLIRKFAERNPMRPREGLW